MGQPRQRQQHWPAWHVGRGAPPTQSGEAAAQRRRKPKVGPQNGGLGVPAGSVSGQSDAKAISVASRADRVIAETIDALELPPRFFVRARTQGTAPRPSTIQVNEVEDSEGRRRRVRACTRPGKNRAVRTWEIEWLIGKADRQSLKRTVHNGTK